MLAITTMLAVVSCSATTGIPQAAETTASSSVAPPLATGASTSSRSILDPDDGTASDAACKLVSWQDLPADVRSATWAPRPKKVEDNPNIADCWLDNSSLGVIVHGPGKPGGGNYQPASDYFIVHVNLGKDIYADPSSYRGDPTFTEVREITIDGEYPGVLLRDYAGIGDGTAPRCVVAFRTTKNKALVRITNSRFANHDVCDLAIGLAERLAPRVDEPR